jgi:4-diphosphocytidyl-2-C-methyl-D-erythritol kinase
VRSDPETAAVRQRFQTEAPAKINLGLRIVGRRPDGYHELESLFLPLDLADHLTLELIPAAAREVVLRLESADGVSADAVPADDANLAVRAARAFLAEAGISAAVELRLTKRIPAAAGLGGGSSDGAAVLRMLDRAHPGAVAPGRLARLALELGADVPYFLDPRPAWVTGIGERIEPLPDWPALAALLVNPGVPLSTAEVFRAADALGPAGRGSGDRPTRSQCLALARSAATAGPDDLAPLLGNDLEAAAVRLCPPVARLRERLLRLGAGAVGMSGSGPTLFGLFPGVDGAREALGRAAFQPPIWARVAVTAKAG